MDYDTFNEICESLGWDDETKKAVIDFAKLVCPAVAVEEGGESNGR